MSAWSPRVSSSKRRASFEQPLERGVVVRGLVVEEDEVLGARHLAQLHADDVARVAPVGLHADRLGERVHRVEDHHVGVAEEGGEVLGLGAVLELVLGIGRVDHRLAVALEAVAVRIAAVQLQVRRHREAVHLVGLVGLELHELDRGAELLPPHREAGRRLLQAEGLLEDVVAAVDADLRPRHVRGPKKGKPMMWSQCTWDMKMFTVAGLRACLASTCTPKGRAPLPMSQT